MAGKLLRPLATQLTCSDKNSVSGHSAPWPWPQWPCIPVAPRLIIANT